MRKRNIISAVAITIAIATGATAYAASNDTNSVQQGQRLGLGRITSMRGYDFMTNILKNKLGLSDADLESALKDGKTPYELATEKGITQEQFKGAMLEEKSNAIDEAVEKGTLPKEEGENLKAKLNENIQNCTGNFGQGLGRGQGCGLGQGQGQGRGMMRNGQGRFNN